MFFLLIWLFVFDIGYERGKNFFFLGFWFVLNKFVCCMYKNEGGKIYILNNFDYLVKLG